MPKKTEKPVPRAERDAATVKNVKRTLTTFAKRAEESEMAVKKVRGILEGAASADTLDNLRHRVKSVVGHRRAIKSAFATLFQIVVECFDLDSELG